MRKPKTSNGVYKNNFKIPLDKYYTGDELARYCVEKTKEVIGAENITAYLEPSAGAGAFLPHLTDKPFIAFDIAPEHDKVRQADFLTLNIKYKKGLCCIGNPPYGEGNKLARQFYKHAIKFCDYISFILPISQLDNNVNYYDFDFVHSEDLGVRNYSGVDVHCCLNIYSRPKNNVLHKRPKHELQCVSILRVDRGETAHDKRPIDFNYSFCDFSICALGSSVGKFAEREDQWCCQAYFKVHPKFKDVVIEKMKCVDWYKEMNFIGTPRINKHHIIKYLKREIEGIY